MSTLLRVRLRNHPDRWVGKSSVSYAFKSDQDPRPLQEDAHWFVPEHRANVWSSVTFLRRVVSLGAHFDRNKAPKTYSEFEVVYPDGTTKPLDDVLRRNNE